MAECLASSLENEMYAALCWMINAEATEKLKVHGMEICLQSIANLHQQCRNHVGSTRGQVG